jgi:uncharacterized membrane protein HdeD (DUF308 family)
VVWWVFMVQGILAILFGGAALLWTPLVVDLVAYFIGALFILYSISTVIRGIRGSGKHRTGLVVIGCSVSSSVSLQWSMSTSSG